MTNVLRVNYATGLRGVTGTTGADGYAGAPHWKWNASALADTDPGGGYIGANTTTLSAISYLYVDNMNLAGVDATGTVDAWDDVDNATTRGRLYITNADNSAWLELSIIGDVTTGATYRNVPVSYVSAGGSLIADETIAVQFAPSGADGSDSGMIGPGTSTDGGMVLFDGTDGTALKEMTGSGMVKVAAGVPAVATEGTDYYEPGGTVVALADGGTGASTAAGARTVFDVYSTSESDDSYATKTYLPNGTGAVTRTVVGKLQESVSVTDFGAVGDGVTDATDAFQAALDTGLNVFVPDGTYLITAGLTMDVSGQQIFGSAGTGLNYATIGGARIIFSVDDAAVSPVLLTCTAPQALVANLQFTGDSGNTTDICIKGELTGSNTDDLDISVVDCMITGFYEAVIGIGRGVQVDRCTIVQATYAVTVDWPSSGTAGADIQTADLYKGRATQIVNCRMHSCTYTCRVIGYDLRGALIANNSVDIGDGLLVVEQGAGLKGCVVSGNVCDFMGQGIVRCNAGASIDGLLITGNKIWGASAGTVDDIGDSRPLSHFRADSPTAISGVQIVGNYIGPTDAYAVLFTNDSSGSAITLYDIQIVGNLFSEIGSDGSANRAVVKSVYDINGFMFTNNQIRDLGATVTGVIATSSNTITDVVVRNNIFDNSVTLFYTTTLDGKIDVDHKSGGYGINTSGQFKIGDLGAYTGSLPFVMSRTGSSGGVGTSYVNSAGSFSIFGTPTGTNDGSYVPGTDNTITLGSAPFRWEQLFAGTATISTSDERLKEQIRGLSTAERAVASRLKSLLVMYKFRDSVARKGNAARIHAGIIAQRVIDAFASEGLDANDYGILCFDSWDAVATETDTDGNIINPGVPAGDRYGLRYEELLMFIMAADAVYDAPERNP